MNTGTDRCEMFHWKWKEPNTKQSPSEGIEEDAFGGFVHKPISAASFIPLAKTPKSIHTVEELDQLCEKEVKC